VLDSRLAHARAVWHLFVLAGSVTHDLAILNYIP
jgi:predicted membrane channel-forming protein YqfA (hemolysin III family)